MKVTKEEVLRNIDRIISGNSTSSVNLQLAKNEMEKISASGRPDGEWNIHTHRPVVGKLIVFVKRCLRKLLHGYIPPLVKQQNALFDEQNKVLWFMLEAMKELTDRNSALELSVQSMQQKLPQLQKEISDRNSALELSVQSMQQKLLQLQKEISDRNSALELSVQGIQQELPHLQKSASQFDRAAEIGRFEMPAIFNEMYPYAEFENEYRGSSESVEECQKVYLEYFVDKKNVLDLGCGRGEFLKLLEMNGMHGKGIDVADDMLAYCREQGLEVEHADIFEYLEQLPDSCLDGVFCNQVVEHFTTPQLMKLIALLKRVVRIGGVVVIETINPGNLYSAANGFYMDLTHIRPINSATLAFLMKHNGFPQQNTLYIHPETDKMIPELVMDGAEEFNRKMKTVNSMLFGERDYGLIAYRQ